MCAEEARHEGGVSRRRGGSHNAARSSESESSLRTRTLPSPSTPQSACSMRLLTAQGSAARSVCPPACASSSILQSPLPVRLSVRVPNGAAVVRLFEHRTSSFAVTPAVLLASPLSATLTVSIACGPQSCWGASTCSPAPGNARCTQDAAQLGLVWASCFGLLSPGPWGRQFGEALARWS